MKKKLTAILTILTLFAVTFSGSITTYAKSAADDGLYVKFNKPFTKENKTYFPLFIYNRDGYHSTATFRLKDHSGKVLATWKNFSVYPFEDKRYQPYCDMRNFPAGNCYFYVYLQKPWDKNNWYVWKEKIYNNSGGLTFRQTALRETNDGKLVPKISVNYKNVKGKDIYLEIQDHYGNTIYKKKGSKPTKHKNGIYNFTWDGKVKDTYYPSDYYHVRVGFSGGKWIESDMYLDFSRAY